MSKYDYNVIRKIEMGVSMKDSEVVIERDIIQARLVCAIFSRAVKGQIALKGGYALRALMGSQRFTKDIDLGQDRSQSLPRLQAVIRAAIKDASQGFLHELNVTEPKQTDTTARWKISGVTSNKTVVHLTIEVSRRGIPVGHIKEKLFVPPMDARANSVSVDVYDDGAMVMSKIFALTGETRLAPRDLFDLDLLIKMNVEPGKDLLDQIPNKREMIEKVWRKVDLMTYDLFKSEVVPFLPIAARGRISEAVFDDMKITVGEKIESWLSEDDAQNDFPVPR